MNSNHIDVASLPELKISRDTFDVLMEFSGNETPVAVNGATWKHRVNLSSASPEFVICRYRSHQIGGSISIEMLRPVVTGPMQNANLDGYRRKKR